MKIKLNKMKLKKVLPLLVMFLLAGNFFFACKKIDLVRIAYVKTETLVILIRVQQQPMA